jgi:hypothetical protein
MSLGCSQQLPKNGWGTHVLRVLSKIAKKGGGRMPSGCFQKMQKNGGGRMSFGCFQKSQKNNVLCLSISKSVHSKWVWQILRFECRFFVMRKISKTTKPSNTGPYPSDLHEIGCKTNRTTRPMVPVTAPRPETVKRRSFFKIFESVENCKVGISLMQIANYYIPIYYICIS